jgi:hypothetical protein
MSNYVTRNGNRGCFAVKRGDSLEFVPILGETTFFTLVNNCFNRKATKKVLAISIRYTHAQKIKYQILKKR